MKIGILDYNACNLKSVFNSIYRQGYDPIVVKDYEQFGEIDKLVIPGVGSANQAIKYMNKNGLTKGINELLLKEIPILGICLGMQIFAKKLYEGGLINGIGYIDAEIQALNKNKISRIGWYKNKIDNNLSNKLLLDKSKSFYFCHAYYFKNFSNNDKKYCLGFVDQDKAVPSIIIKNKFIGTQFHPEKSQENGTKILNLFLERF